MKGRLPRVLVVLPHQAFWFPDYAGLRDGLAGKAEMVVASSDLSPAKPDPEGGGEPVEPALTLKQAREADYDAVVFSGGRVRMEYAFQPPYKHEARDFIEQMQAKGKMVGGLCIGAAVLGEAGVLKGKNATGFPKVRPKLEAAGATYLDQPVVVTDRLITGKNDLAARPFAERLLKEMSRPAK